MDIRLYTASDEKRWDSYVYEHPESSHCHLSGWKAVIEGSYHHQSCYLLAEEKKEILGVLPLFYLKSFLFGKQVVSMPFLNYGGVLANTKKVSLKLIQEAIRIFSRKGASIIELRHLNNVDVYSGNRKYKYFKNVHKVRMILELPETADKLFQSFKSKLRSQIRRPQKEGMTAIVGGSELIENFYEVFSVNMRDLGSPVHSKKFFQAILSVFKDNAKVGVVYYKHRPVAVGIIMCYRDTVEIPWASSLRKYNRYSPNMFLYWTLLKFACDHGFRYFDFGRSTVNESTFRFKRQWGAIPQTLFWHVFIKSEDSKNGDVIADKDSKSMNLAIALWQKLPIAAANFLGPRIRKSIRL